MNYDFSFDRKSGLLTLACLGLTAVLLLIAGFLAGTRYAGFSQAASFDKPVSSPPAIPLKIAGKSSKMPGTTASSSLDKAPTQTSSPGRTALPENARSNVKPDSEYALQFGAFHDRAKAEALVKELKDEGTIATVFSAMDLTGAEWFTVRSGHYSSVEEATQAAVKARRADQTTPIVRPAQSL
jgi:cell division protein FtsN